MEYNEKDREAPGPAEAEASVAEGLPFCSKAFAQETERLEDDDDPCQNGEG